jgi:NAD(P)-dependent dehydrogenase (short-subunit alcohol dehydrogenase family)
MAAPARVALVTGAARRLGRAMALDLGRAGWAVAVHHRTSRAEAEEVVASITGDGGRAVALAADLAHESEVDTLFDATLAALGAPTLLVNNASLFERDGARDATRAGWDAHIETNLRAPFRLAQRFAEALPTDAEGLVVNLLDQRVWALTPHFMSYTVSKAGLWTLTRTLALALAPRIRVNAIGPGPALASIHQTPEQFARQCASVPLGRGTDPDEVCRTLRFLIEARSMTGQMIALDGGQHLGWTFPAPDAPPVED